ncbi:hypothetical protein HAX54_005426, partial [Datura stramonium]|nr:hypothetical protein [Datura stramonium]
DPQRGKVIDAELGASLKYNRLSPPRANQQNTPTNPSKEIIATRDRNFLKRDPPEFYSPKAYGRIKGEEKGSKRARIRNISLCKNYGLTIGRMHGWPSGFLGAASQAINSNSPASLTGQ